MIRKKALSLASLLTILLVSFAFNFGFGHIPTTPPDAETHRYIVMEGELRSTTQMGVFPATWWVTPYQTRDPWLTPLFGEQNITFSDPDPVTGIVNLTVPANSYIGVEHSWYDTSTSLWFNMNVTMAEDGYGWLFTGTGSSPILGDVDITTFNNDTGVYFFGPDGLNGTADDSSADLIASAGDDQIPGTLDDDFGTLNTTAGTPRTPDPPGSSVLYLPSTLHVEWWSGTAWDLLFESPWPQVLTTATAYDIVIEPNSDINGCNSTDEGHPWEFLAGLDHPEYDPVPHGHPKWNAYVKYACAWSILNHDTALGALDVMFQMWEKLVRDDCAIADIDCNELVDIVDIVIAALTFGKRDEGPGPDGLPETGDDRPVADPGYDARGDVADSRGLVDIVDIVRIAINFGWKLTPGCIIK